MESGKGTGSGWGCSQDSASEIRPVASGYSSPGTSASREKMERRELNTAILGVAKTKDEQDRELCHQNTCSHRLGWQSMLSKAMGEVEWNLGPVRS